MTTILAIFLLSFILAVFFSFLARKAGIYFKLIDAPEKRKVHATPIPRSGGIGIFLAFNLCLLLIPLMQTKISNLLRFDQTVLFFLLGGLICFITGLMDDYKSRGPWLKFGMQILAVSLVFWGGLRISNVFHFSPENGSVFPLVASYLLTLFWFLLLINAVNLIDGLDGLAGGIILFTCMIMTIFLVMDKNFFLAIFFAALGGAVTGFLPYNFSTGWKLFLGDSGSYVLGYAVAGLAVMGSVKSQVGAILLIPLVAMGVPVFEAIFSPLRRFILAKDPFRPDKGHIHHRLLSLGFTSRKAVFLLYGLTLGLCIMAVVMVNIRNEEVGLFIVILGAMAVVFLRSLGYFGYMDKDKLQSWLKDFSYITGVAKDRRRFLNLQMMISQSKNLENLWSNICNALDELEVDFAEINIEGSGRVEQEQRGGRKSEKSATGQSDKGTLNLNRAMYRKAWSNNGFEINQDAVKRNLFKLELPLQIENEHIGEFWIIKDLERSPINHYTLTRIEHLRRSISRCLADIIKANR